MLDLIGGTPLVRLSHIEPPGIEIWAKCEFCNPGGSVKDRPALQMVRDALADGRLTPDKTLIDATSGNTGVAYSLVGAALGIRVAGDAGQCLGRAQADHFGLWHRACLFLRDGRLRRRDSHGARAVVAEPARYFYPDQYSNESNPRAHYLGTGPEILALVGDRLTHFVAGVGTSGTVMGTGRRLREHRRPDGGRVTVVAVEPDDAFHGLEGLKHMASSIVPAIWRPDEAVDRIPPMSTEEGWKSLSSSKSARACSSVTQPAPTSRARCT